MKVALIAAPWPLFNRPSIQTGALKAFVKLKMPAAVVRCFHPYLNSAQMIGFSKYYAVSQSSFASEAVGAALLFPENHRRCEKVFSRHLLRRGARHISFSEIKDALEKALSQFVADTDWRDFSVAGLSVCLNQLTASLWIAMQIKRLNPQCKIVFGGSSCSGKSGRSLLENFHQIDYVINGEGETPFLNLLRYLNGDTDNIGEGAGILTKNSNLSLDSVKNQTENLDHLPIPDYDDYFRELSRLDPGRRFFPELPIEFSRGCWWRRCAFCNLNLQWENYRQKKAARMAEEIETLASRYNVLDFAFMDNALPKAQAARFFKSVKTHRRDYRFFAEIRAVHTSSELAVMSDAGLKDVQVGIEAISASLLKRLAKGTSVLDNIAIMRNAYEAGILLQGNLIVHFPGSTPEEVEETLLNLDFLWPFPPLKTVSFWLGRGSPVEQDPKGFGISGIKTHHVFTDLFPREVAQKLSSMILEYKGDKLLQHQLWKQVEVKVRSWNREWKKMVKERPLLSYRDGRDFMVIRQVLPGGKTLYHRLVQASRQLYLTATQTCTISDLEESAPNFSKEQIRAFVHQMMDKRLMFCEGDRVISLAVKAENWRNR